MAFATATRAATTASTASTAAVLSAQLEEERSSLAQIFEEALLVDSTNPQHWTLQVIAPSNNSCAAVLALDFPDAYPFEPVFARIRSKCLSRDQCDRINKELAAAAAAQAGQGEVAVFALASQLKDAMDALSTPSTPAASQAATPSTRKTASAETAVVDAKKQARDLSSSDDEETDKSAQRKPRMRPAQDVVSRLKHDPEVPSEHMIVGYEDRFVGILELPFTAFNWTDAYAALGPLDVAIPKHRIMYFKCKDRVLWDRKQRVDNVFGSTVGGRHINDVLAEMRLAGELPEPAAPTAAVDDEEEEEREERFNDEDDEDEDEQYKADDVADPWKALSHKLRK